MGRTVSNGPAPVAASHQRLLSLKQSEIQERLIKNKTLLNVVEPTLTNHSLDVFLEILQRRIELDKDVLFQYTQLRKETSAPGGGKSAPDSTPDVVVAPLLMKFSHGCQQVNCYQLFQFNRVIEPSTIPGSVQMQNGLGSSRVAIAIVSLCVCVSTG